MWWRQWLRYRGHNRELWTVQRQTTTILHHVDAWQGHDRCHAPHVTCTSAAFACGPQNCWPSDVSGAAFAQRARGGRMAQTAAHLVECVTPWMPTRQWVVSVPIPLRYWMSSSRDLTAQMHTIVRTTIAQYYVNQAVRRDVTRQRFNRDRSRLYNDSVVV